MCVSEKDTVPGCLVDLVFRHKRHSRSVLIYKPRLKRFHQYFQSIADNNIKYLLQKYFINRWQK